MATSQGTIEFLLDQLQATGSATAKKMFGEYCLYLDGKPVGVVCDDQLYLKPTEAGRAMLSEVLLASPYPKARAHLLIAADLWDESDWLCELLQASARELPMPKAQKRKTTT